MNLIQIHELLEKMFVDLEGFSPNQQEEIKKYFDKNYSDTKTA